jgi:CRISPR system Cascade subunit CasC
MSKFIQLHLLTSYPPANLNRDDLGRPKTAKMGGVDRLRVSSQSLKRAWRTSALFQSAVGGDERVGKRTKKRGELAYQQLIDGGIGEKNAKEWAKAIAGAFGSNKKDNPLEIEQLAHISPNEDEAVDELVALLVRENRAPEVKEIAALKKQANAVDIALFGRMLASSPAHNVEAACQVAHAISVHPVVIEDDYFTAVDDLNEKGDDAGAGHIGEAGFAAGLFYLYICIDKTLLSENLGEDKELVDKTIKGIIETAVKVGPTGKQNSFASRAYATYALGEVGDDQPRSLSVAYLQPIAGSHDAKQAIERLEEHRDKQADVYGKCWTHQSVINTLPGPDAKSDSLDVFIATMCE